MNGALFLDRDGVINERLVDDYVRTPEELVLLRDVVPILRQARTLGYRLILISNQQGVGKGLMSLNDLERVHAAMQNALAEDGVKLDAIYVCTDLASSGSMRRKPQPGMLFEAMADHHLDASCCWFLGDSITDAQAGRAAGVKTALVGSHPADAADIVAPSLHAITGALLAALGDTSRTHR